MKLLITGVAGFIGMHTAKRLCNDGHSVIGIDNINSYYDVSLKYARLQQLGISKNDIVYNQPLNGQNQFTFIELDLQDAGNLMALFAHHQFDMVIHLAAQAGVRYSITNPRDYLDSNLVGFFNLLECCRTFPVKHFVFASSSSVYGNSSEVPFQSNHNTDHPISLYAATKKANEVIMHSYSHLYQIPSTGLRFFTVYGPWGRPDMAYFSFTKNILEGKSIELFEEGKLKRDFTYIDDAVECICRLLHQVPSSTKHGAPYRILNIGNHKPEAVSHFLQIIEKLTQRNATIHYKPKQAGDVDITYADTSDTYALIQFEPNTTIEYGLQQFVDWYTVQYPA